MTVEIDGANNIIKTNTINEVTSANGITIDGLNIKDSKLVTANSVVEANITNGAVTSGKIASGVVPTLRPNAKPLVVNSNMAIAQRNSGTVAQSDGSNEGYATVDRMNLVFGNSAGGTITTSRDNTAPTGFGQSMKFDVTSADGSVASNQIVYMKTTLEAQDIRNSGWNYTSSSSYLTLSFWVRSSKTGIYCAFLETLDASYMRSSEYTISSADTWEQKVLTFPGKTELVFNNDNGAGLNIGFTFAVGTDRDGTNNTWETTNYGTSNQVNFLDSTSNILYLTGIQLEVGEFSSTNLPPFQHESYGDNLLRCQRYYQLVQNWSGGVVNSSTAYINATFWKTMRTTPSVTTTGALNGNDIANNVNQSSGQVTLHGANENGFWGGIGNFSSLTTNNPFNSRFQNTNKLAFSSEL
tara:strand:+ start:2789 stop:4021 length:1233 start_codon:yes stop_codon:yes gene_type:complete